MNKQEDFLSPQQNKLINFAIWTKYLAWLMLFVYIVLAISVVVQNMDISQNIFVTPPLGYSFCNQIHCFLINIGSNILIRLLAGVTYFVALKGISLGLYMIVETDINYREKQEGTNE